MNKIRIISYSLLASFLTAMPAITRAAIPQDFGGPNAPSTLNIKLENPLSSKIGTIPEFIKAVLNIVLTVGIPIVAIFIIYSGFLFVKARGNEGELTKAKDTLLYTIIGAAILLGAWVLAQAIGSTVKELGKGI